MKDYQELMALCRFWRAAYDLYHTTADIRDSSAMNHAKSRIFTLRDKLQLDIFEYYSETEQMADIELMALDVIMKKGQIE